MKIKYDNGEVREIKLDEPRRILCDWRVDCGWSPPEDSCVGCPARGVSDFFTASEAETWWRNTYLDVISGRPRHIRGYTA